MNIAIRQQEGSSTEIAATFLEPFTAADYLATERMVGHEVSYYRDREKLFISVYFGNRKYKKATRNAYIDGLWRFRSWQDANPNWKEQVVAELDREKAAA
ncbi:hypothetical protein AB4037_08690 [Labrys sp. KB_33_2]|uniref:hypothetical protein n=1 Tax=Labrys sp. KB_33_2 TaxID=3237479 RepID=UPI003F8F54E5